MKTFLQFFTEGRPLKYTQEIQDKMVAYKKENPGASFESIGKIFNAASNLVYKIVSKNWPGWRKYSTVVRGMPPIDQELHDKVVAYKKENPSKTVREIGEVFNISHSGVVKILNKNWPGWQKSSTTKTGPKAKYTQEIQDKVVKPGRKPGSILASDINDKFETEDDDIKGKILVYDTIKNRKPVIALLTKIIIDRKAKGKNVDVGFLAKMFEVSEETVFKAKYNADKDTGVGVESERFNDNPDYSKLYGKLENRKEEFEYIKPVVDKMGTELTVFSLAHKYDFEKTFAKTFNKKLIVYSTMYGETTEKEKEYGAIANKVNSDPNSNIKTYISRKDINALLMDPRDRMSSYFRLDPLKGSGWFKENQIFLPDQLDIIDLDYKGIPGSLTSQPESPPMRLHEDHNPFLYPVKAAKMLKSGGLLFVTYLLRGQNKMHFGRTKTYEELNKYGIKSSDKEINDDLLSLNNGRDWGFLEKDNPPVWAKKSLVTKQGGKYNYRPDTYNEYYQYSNLYSAGILRCAKQNGVDITAIYTNIYSGAAPSVMYRGVFLKH